MSTRREAGFFGWVTELVRRERSALFRLARREGLRGEDAWDITQEAFVNYLALPQARMLVEDAQGSARLLMVLARNLARNRRRRADRALPHVAEPETVQALPDDHESVDELIERSEEHLRLLGCMDKLKKAQHAVVSLRLLEDRRGEDVARQLALAPGHVAVLLSRAKANLAQCMMLAAQ